MVKLSYRIRKNQLYVGGTYTCDIAAMSCTLKAFIHFLEHPDVGSSIVNYTCENYKNVNRLLRSTKPGDELQPSPRYDLDQACKILHDMCLVLCLLQPVSIEQGKYVSFYRGVKDGRMFNNFANNSAFLSCTSSFDRAAYFTSYDTQNSNNYIVEVILLPGYVYKLLPVETVTGCPNEWEVILPPNMGQMVKLGEASITNGNTIQKYVYIPLQELSKPDTDYAKVIENLTKIEAKGNEVVNIQYIINQSRQSNTNNAKAIANQQKHSPEAYGQQLADILCKRQNLLLGVPGNEMIKAIADHVMNSFENKTDAMECAKWLVSLPQSHNADTIQRGLLEVFKDPKSTDSPYLSLYALKVHLMVLNWPHPNA